MFEPGRGRLGHNAWPSGAPTLEFQVKSLQAGTTRPWQGSMGNVYRLSLAAGEDENLRQHVRPNAS
jgi:hypothetical protein